jgi:hypothetical protein
MSMYNSDGSDAENNDDDTENEGVLTQEQIRMKDLLEKKGKEIVMGLLDKLSNKNQDKFEETLNANTVLMEFCDNDQCFAMLTTPEALQYLIKICCQGSTNMLNLPYALNLLTTIINEFGNTDKEIADDRKLQIQQQFAKFFPDIAYNCVIILRSRLPTDGKYTNQAAIPIQKIGTHRIRAMELIKTLFVTLNKMKDGRQLISGLLKTKVIETMLYMIKTYPFCCISHQQSIQILNALKESFDKDDVATLKAFILVDLQGQAKFTFPSGR